MRFDSAAKIVDDVTKVMRTDAKEDDVTAFDQMNVVKFTKSNAFVNEIS